MIIDGIEYPLPLDNLRKFADCKLIDASKGNFLLYFKTGELTLSASRESIYFDEETQYLLKMRIAEISKEIKQKISAKIDSCPDLWTANVYYKQELKNIFSDLRFLGPLFWKAIRLSEDNSFAMDCVVYHFIKGNKFRNNYSNPNPNKINRAYKKHLIFEESSMLIVNDLPIKDVTTRHIKKAFDNDVNLKSVQVIMPSDTVTIKNLESSIHLDKMNPNLLSLFTKSTTVRKAPTISKVLVFKFKNGGFNQISYSDMMEDPKNKVLCLFNKKDKSDTQIVVKNSTLNCYKLKYVADNHLDKSFYGIHCDISPDRLKKDFAQFEQLEVIIDKMIKNIDFVKVKHVTQSYDAHLFDGKMLSIINNIKPLITKNNSIFLQCVDFCESVQKASKERDLLSIYESIYGEVSQDALDKFVQKNPSYDIKKIMDKYNNNYPLIVHLHYYDIKEILGPLVHYINLVDNC